MKGNSQNLPVAPVARVQIHSIDDALSRTFRCGERAYTWGGTITVPDATGGLLEFSQPQLSYAADRFR